MAPRSRFHWWSQLFALFCTLPSARAGYEWKGPGAPQACRVYAEWRGARVSCEGVISDPEMTFVAQFGLPDPSAEEFHYLGTRVDMNMTIYDVFTSASEIVASQIESYNEQTSAAVANSIAAANAAAQAAAAGLRLATASPPRPALGLNGEAHADATSSQAACRCDGHSHSDGYGGADCMSIEEGKPYCYTQPGVCEDGLPSESGQVGHEWSFKACVKAACECDGHSHSDGYGGADCKSIHEGKPYCYTQPGVCEDDLASRTETGHEWSFKACVKARHPARAEKTASMMSGRTMQVLVGFGNTFTSCGGNSGQHVHNGSETAISLLCFTGEKSRTTFSASIVTTIPIRVGIAAHITRKLQAIGKPVRHDTRFGGTTLGDTVIMGFNIERPEPGLERLKFKVSSSRLGAPRLTIHAFVFNENSTCIRRRIREGGCANPMQVIRCLQSYDIGFNEREESEMNAIGQHLTFHGEAMLTLSAASLPVRATGRWFVLFTCDKFLRGLLSSTESYCDETKVTLSTEAESDVAVRVAWGALGMLAAPLGALFLIDFLYFLAYYGLKVFHPNSDREDKFSRISSGVPGRHFWNPKTTWHSLRSPRFFFTPLLALMVGVFIATAGQFVATHWGLMERTGNRDICYLNERCYYPMGELSIPVNHMLSHVPYFVVGIHLMYKAAFAEYKSARWLRKAESSLHLSHNHRALDLSPFYTIAGSFMAEGIGSACYHVCPSVETFQFDTCFMIPIAHFMCIGLCYFPDDTSTEMTMIQPLKYFLFVLTPIWAFNFVGTWYDVGVMGYEGWHVVPYLIFAISVLSWAFVAASSLDYCFFQPTHTLGRGGGILKNALKGIVVGGLACSMYPPWRALLGGMANVFLLLSIVVMIGVTSWQVWVLEIVHLEKSCGPILKALVKFSYLPIMLYVTYEALKFFTDKVVVVSPGISPAESHSSNQDCYIGIFDLHDIWHTLSAIGLALAAKILIDVKMHCYARTSSVQADDDYSSMNELSSMDSDGEESVMSARSKSKLPGQ